MTGPNPTIAMSRYAAEIYRLQEHHEYVGLTELSSEVDASLQATSRMIARLREGGFLEHEPYKGVRLTELGQQIAMPAIRRHRLAELFLVRQMGFGWDEVHDMTDRFEQGISDEIEDRIFQVLGEPARCPHGEPIPPREGPMPQLDDISLTRMPAARSYVVSRVRVHDPARLRYVADLGLLPGAHFDLVSFSPFEGPVRIRVQRSEQVISYDLASALWVFQNDPAQ